MVWAKGFFSDRQGTFVKRFCLFVLALDVIEHREVVQALGNAGMVWAKGFFSNRQCTFVERIRLFILAGIVIRKVF